MKTLIIILILAAFLQSTILPVDLSLMILILRSFIKPERSNLYLAFFSGLLLSHLTFSPWGLYSLIYLCFVSITQILTKSRLSNHFVVIVPITFVFLLAQEIILSLWFHTSLQIWPKIFIMSILALPIYILIRFWEERFVVSKDIKLRV